MSRPAGKRNADFDQTRAEILDRVLHAVARHPDRSSFAQLAEVSGVSRTTLRHYFRSRDDLMRSMLEHMRVLSDRAAAAFPVSSALPLEAALRLALHQLVFAWRVGMGGLFTAGLFWGLADEQLGTVYVSSMLEPLLVSFEGHIVTRLAAENLSELEARHAAIALVSPVVVALLHQEALHGLKCRPLDVDAFVEEHLKRFIAGWLTREPKWRSAPTVLRMGSGARARLLQSRS